MTGRGRLLATSDLHIGHPDNREVLHSLYPGRAEDWLIVAGDVGENADDIVWALSLLAQRFARVLWVPGNHELWTRKRDSVTLRGEHRYRHLVARCREIGVVTPEDEYPVFRGEGGPVRIAPLFLLYDYTFRPEGAATKAEALEIARKTGVVCTDEYLLHPDPYETRDDWCRARIAATEARLAACPDDLPLVLVNHYPLLRRPTDVLRYPQFAQWCGTELTADWHTRFRVAAVVYGHLHIPRVTWHDGVRFEEVSVGYPREWRRRGDAPRVPRQILPRVAEAA